MFAIWVAGAAAHAGSISPATERAVRTPDITWRAPDPWLPRMRGVHVRVSEQSSTSVSIEDIQAAQGRISAETIRTPLVLSAAASDRAGVRFI